MVNAEGAKKFLDELASAAYELRTKYKIPQEDFICNPSVRIDTYISNADAYMNVSKLP
jgi:hypothetical protein